MSYLYKDGKYITTRDFFVGKKAYKENARLAGVELLDTWYQHVNYGLLNDKYEPVVLNTDENSSGLSSPQSATGPEVKLASFVTQAFDDFHEFYISEMDKRRLDYPPFIDRVTPVSGWVSFDDQYRNYISKIVPDYADLVLSRISSLDQFEETLTKIVERNISSIPITKSGFLLSEKCPKSVSGMTVELANLSFEDDSQKTLLLESEEFKCYAEIATEFGFYVDKNAPWRLVANLESPKMKNYLNIYRPGTPTEIILEKVFRSKTHHEDISGVFYFYYSVFKEVLRVAELQRNYSFPTKNLISTTLKIRMLETGLPMEDYNKNKREILDLEAKYGNRYSKTPWKQASGKIGKLCSEKIKEIYLAKHKKNSYSKTTLKDYM